MKRTLKGIRADLNLSQQEMAKRLGMARQTYAKKEKGQVPLLANELLMVSVLSRVPMDEIEVPNSLFFCEESQATLDRREP